MFLIVILVIALLCGAVVMGSRRWGEVLLAVGGASAFVSLVALVIVTTPLVEFVKEDADCSNLLCREWVQVLLLVSPVLAAMLLFPLVLLAIRIKWVNFPGFGPVAGYVVVYTLWLNVIIGYVAYLVDSIIHFHQFSLESRGYGTESVIAIWYVMIALGSFTWASSLLRLRRGYVQYKERHGGVPPETVPDGEFLYPHAWLFVWVLVFPVVAVISYAIASP